MYGLQFYLRSIQTWIWHKPLNVFKSAHETVAVGVGKVWVWKVYAFKTQKPMPTDDRFVGRFECFSNINVNLTNIDDKKVYFWGILPRSPETIPMGGHKFMKMGIMCHHRQFFYFEISLKTIYPLIISVSCGTRHFLSEAQKVALLVLYKIKMKLVINIYWHD